MATVHGVDAIGFGDELNPALQRGDLIGGARTAIERSGCTIQSRLLPGCGRAVCIGEHVIDWTESQRSSMVRSRKR
jgi:hypothetical protein